MDIDIIERLVRMETKLDMYNEQRKMELKHLRTDVDELKDNQKWFRRMVLGSVGTAVLAFIFSIGKN